jgi:polysaccharide export outer membrane protein
MSANRIMKTLLLAAGLGLLVCQNAGAQAIPPPGTQPQAQPQPLKETPRPPPPASIRSVEKYVFHPGDKVELRVMESRDEPVLLTVSPGGEIEVPYLGKRLVIGKSIPEVQDELKKEYEKDYYYKATVIISIAEITQPTIERQVRRIYVTGQVPAQGAQEMPDGETYTVSKAILKAGGLAPFANGRKVRVVRKGQASKDPKNEDQLIVDVLSILEDGKVENDIELQPDDLVIVPEKLINW